MNVLITGATGFVGSHLVRFFTDRGDQVVAMGRRPDPGLATGPRYRYLRADTTVQGDWQAEVSRARAVINLAGQTIFKRWSRRYKQKIRDSRILTTRNLVEALDDEAVLCSTSAVGFYGNRGDDPLTEDEPNGADFLAAVARDWEAEALAAQNRGVRVILARFGLVLGTDGGALAKMVPAFRALTGGPMGNGHQWIPWIHIRDLAAALAFAVDDERISGPVNICAPNPVRNRDLAKNLGQQLNRPAVVPAPAFALRMAMGEMADVLLASQRAVPRVLENAGFTFEFNDLPPALADLLRVGD